jgi:hypothetical protein
VEECWINLQKEVRRTLARHMYSITGKVPNHTSSTPVPGVGPTVGRAVGDGVGELVGRGMGLLEGRGVGLLEGRAEGERVGTALGAADDEGGGGGRIKTLGTMAIVA